ncbi:unnamed protein product, partial [Allacma fusca]
MKKSETLAERADNSYAKEQNERSYETRTAIRETLKKPSEDITISDSSSSDFEDV